MLMLMVLQRKLDELRSKQERVLRKLRKWQERQLRQRS